MGIVVVVTTGNASGAGVIKIIKNIPSGEQAAVAEGGLTALTAWFWGRQRRRRHQDHQEHPQR
jgi:hypothetical protein